MHPYPHRYTVSASGTPVGNVAVTATGLPDIETAPPAEFDGPGDVWSPESLLCASVADCFILTFRAIARASKFEWSALSCRVDAVLERVDGAARFTRYTTHATLRVAAGGETARAHTLLEKAEQGCLVANSLKGERTLEVQIIDQIG
jgi:organic hydroperoxide reductase OsmC/OhrA